MTALYNMQISPQIKCITVKMTKGAVGFKTLLPPGCFPTPLSSAGAACHASRAPLGGLCSTKACCLLRFLPKVCSQGDCNLPPFLSKPWLTGKLHSPGPSSSASVCLSPGTQAQCPISFLQMHPHTDTLTCTDLYCMVWGHQSVNQC